VEVQCLEEIWREYQADPPGSGYSFIVCKDGSGPVVAYACFGPHPLTQGTFDLYWIAVEPAARGRGVAHLLLSEAERRIRDLGGRLLLVETSSTGGYSAARNLYAGCGYRLEATVHDFYAPGDDLMMYAKDLELPGPGKMTAQALAEVGSAAPC
jgi:ribosomal protein S18 acetylase RimI-like enzyme